MVPKTNATWMIENAVAGYTDVATGKNMQLQVRAAHREWYPALGSVLAVWMAPLGRSRNSNALRKLSATLIGSAG